MQLETPGTSKMGFFAILLTFMTKNSIFDVGRDPEFTIGICVLIFISLQFWDIIRNIEKPEQSHWKGLEKGFIVRKN